MGLGRLFGRKEKVAPGSPATQSLYRAPEGEIKRFLGGAMHAYPLTKVKGNACPRCGGALEQHRCSVAYMGSEESGSVDTTDAWFCGSCKSAVLDEKAIKRKVREQGDKYMAAIGLDVGKDDPAFFDSWDGEGEAGGAAASPDSGDDEMAKMMRAMFGMGDSGADEAPAPGTAAKRKQRKSKRKQSSKARKKNRRK